MTGLVPPRPNLVPPGGTTSPDRPRPSSPSPLGDEVELRRPGTPTETAPTARPRDDLRDDLNRPGTTWLITQRTHPAWTAVLDLLDDERWHPTTDVRQAMHHAADLAPRTIDHHLRAASNRRWISRSRGHVRIRDRQAFEQAIDHMVAGP